MYTFFIREASKRHDLVGAPSHPHGIHNSLFSRVFPWNLFSPPEFFKSLIIRSRRGGKFFPVPPRAREKFFHSSSSYFFFNSFNFLAFGEVVFGPALPYPAPETSFASGLPFHRDYPGVLILNPSTRSRDNQSLGKLFLFFKFHFLLVKFRLAPRSISPYPSSPGFIISYISSSQQFLSHLYIFSISLRFSFPPIKANSKFPVSAWLSFPLPFVDHLLPFDWLHSSEQLLSFPAVHTVPCHYSQCCHYRF